MDESSKKMALKLDDFLIKKKEPAQILDLSKVSVNSQEELKKTMEKVPEYKIKMDKVSDNYLLLPVMVDYD